MIRLAIAVLAVVGVVSLFSDGVSAAGAGLLLLFPILLLAKILFFFVLLGFIGRGFARRGGRRSGPPWEWKERSDRVRPERPSRKDQFEDWHRMAHAREEVDGWVEDAE